MIVKYLTVRERFAQKIKWLQAREPFIFIRFSDSETDGMFGLKTEKNKDMNHHFFKDLGEELLKIAEDVLEESKKDPSHILVGGSIVDPHLAADARTFALFDKLVRDRDCADKVSWTECEFWYSSEDERDNKAESKGVIELIDELRTNHRVVLVTNKTVEASKYCLGAEFIEIPAEDCWLAREDVLSQCFPYAEKGYTFIWCAGMPGKVWSWNLWKQYRQTTHMDFGCFFEAIFGYTKRAWLARNEPGQHYAHQIFLKETLIPYVKKFIS